MPINTQQLHQEILKLAAHSAFSTELIYQADPTPIIALTKKSPNPQAPHIYISAGIHGDEPAGPLAIKALLQEGFFDNAAHWTLIPILNPTGLPLGTRENANKVDLNRDYKNPQTPEITAHQAWLKKQTSPYKLTIALHEDWESPGFYCYAITPNQYKYILNPIHTAVLQYSPINLSQQIEGSPAKNGFIFHTPENFQKLLNEWPKWPETFFLFQNRLNALHFTFETASAQPLQQRVSTHCAAIKAAVKNLQKKIDTSPY